jgi:hypothetical protein
MRAAYDTFTCKLNKFHPSLRRPVIVICHRRSFFDHQTDNTYSADIMDSVLDYYKNLPPTVHTVLGALGALVVVLKAVSTFQFFLSVFVFRGKKVSTSSAEPISCAVLSQHSLTSFCSSCKDSVARAAGPS